jgi:hypothetical protein
LSTTVNFSLKEAICSETPVVYVPLFAEQAGNAFNAHRLGFAEVVNKLNMTPDYLEVGEQFNETDKLQSAMKRVLDTYPTRLRAVQRVRRLMLDRPMSSLDLSVFWVRRLLEHGGHLPEFFYRRAQQMSFFTYIHIDLVLLLLSVLCLLLKK